MAADPATTRRDLNAGATIREALAGYERQGYLEQFASRPESSIRCFACGTTVAAEHVHLHACTRIEGTSDPADEALVAALECPDCGARGTGVFMYGPEASPEDLAVVHDLRDERKPATKP